VIVLDTNILSELMRPAPNPAVVAWLDRQKPGDVATTTITVAEILFGIERLPAGQRRDTFTVLAADMFDQDFAGRLLPFDAIAASLYARQMAALESRGKPIAMADGQIAAICQANRATLATRNTKDFENMEVVLINPWQQG
jgi:hypothetical protein|tara:strand:+ start:34381 stop:34803 length:423 start_codon:yes stop_codon:yes gene_type:complete